jgi:predicted  nucleic acid-binding Zn-ribbon protein
MSVTPGYVARLTTQLVAAREQIKDLERRNGFLQKQIDSLAPALEHTQRELTKYLAKLVDVKRELVSGEERARQSLYPHQGRLL